MDITELKKSYDLLAKKYKLPSFENMNENFEIDKIEKDTISLLRVVRKVMMEKIVNSLSFLELLINPANTPRMYLAYAHSISADDRKTIEEIYTSLGDISLISLDLEIDYSEKSEAEVIKKIANAWNEQKPRFKKILGNMKKPNNISAKKEKTYFG